MTAEQQHGLMFDLLRFVGRTGPPVCHEFFRGWSRPGSVHSFVNRWLEHHTLDVLEQISTCLRQGRPVPFLPRLPALLWADKRQWWLYALAQGTEYVVGTDPFITSCLAYLPLETTRKLVRLFSDLAPGTESATCSRLMGAEHTPDGLAPLLQETVHLCEVHHRFVDLEEEYLRWLPLGACLDAPAESVWQTFQENLDKTGNYLKSGMFRE